MATLDDLADAPAPVLDDEVELLEPGSHTLVIQRRCMTLRDAIAAVLAKSSADQLRCGIGLGEPVRVTLWGRPVLQGYLSGPAVQEIWGDLPARSTRH